MRIPGRWGLDKLLASSGFVDLRSGASKGHLVVVKAM